MRVFRAARRSSVLLPRTVRLLSPTPHHELFPSRPPIFSALPFAAHVHALPPPAPSLAASTRAPALHIISCFHLPQSQPPLPFRCCFTRGAAFFLMPPGVSRCRPLMPRRLVRSTPFQRRRHVCLRPVARRTPRAALMFQHAGCGAAVFITRLLATPLRSIALKTPVRQQPRALRRIFCVHVRMPRRPVVVAAMRFRYAPWIFASRSPFFMPPCPHRSFSAVIFRHAPA